MLRREKRLKHVKGKECLGYLGGVKVMHDGIVWGDVQVQAV